MGPLPKAVSGAILIGIGALLLVIAAGVITLPGKPMAAPAWVVAACGMASILGGVLCLLQALGASQRAPTYSLLVTLMLIAFAAIPGWVAFGPGERRFSRSLVVGLFWREGEASEVEGRVVFGVFAVALAALAFFAGRQFLRSIRPSD
jgi:hypothetical protein